MNEEDLILEFIIESPDGEKTRQEILEHGTDYYRDPERMSLALSRLIDMGKIHAVSSDRGPVKYAMGDQ